MRNAPTMATPVTARKLASMVDVYQLNPFARLTSAIATLVVRSIPALLCSLRSYPLRSYPVVFPTLLPCCVHYAVGQQPGQASKLQNLHENRMRCAACIESAGVSKPLSSACMCTAVCC
jgi:hypothetical protein